MAIRTGRCCERFYSHVTRTEVEKPKWDESGTGRVESGKSRDESGTGWDESAARACHPRSFQPSLQTKTATVCMPTATAHKPRPHRFLAIPVNLIYPSADVEEACLGGDMFSLWPQTAFSP